MSASPFIPRVIFLALVAVLPAFAETIQKSSSWNRASFQQEVLLMEINKDGSFGPGSVEMLEEQEKRKLTKEEKELFGGLDDGKWTVFEDDYVRFELPDNPLLKVEAITPERRSRIKIVGDAVGTTNNRFQRAYRMTVNDLPFGVLLLSEADWFDDGICLCGPIVHKTCVLKEGTLLEFSLLPEGQVKKVQALGAVHRAVLFEWTHSALKAERYQRMGASIRLKKRSDRSLDEWMALEKRHREDQEFLGLGWLRRGDTDGRIRSLLGQPTRIEHDMWVYEKERWDDDGSGRLVALRLRVADGRLAGLPSRLWDSRDLPPRLGSTAWAAKIAEKQTERDKPTTELPQEVAIIYKEFKKQAPDSTAWNKWCQIAHELTEKGYRDEALRDVVAAKFLETRVEQHYSAWLLDDYPSAATEELFRKRVRLVLENCRANLKRPVTDPHEIWNLFSFMALKEEASLALLREAAKHPHDTVRSSAYGQAESLPQAEARALAKLAIQSEKDDHCLTMAAYLIRDVGTKDDVEWLEKEKARFPTKELQEVWQEALDTLRNGKTKG